MTPQEIKERIAEDIGSQEAHTVSVGHSGFVRLVDWMGSDLSIVRAARVSFNADWRAGHAIGSDTKLIRYLLEHEHTSPFEAVVFTFEVKAPIYVLRQWHRHRTWGYNEVSARYTELDEGFHVPREAEITTQSASNKQARTTDQHPAAADIARIIESSCAAAFETYSSLLRRGCPRELARSVLPVAAYSRMFATVNLHNLMRFLKLRLHAHAQAEIRAYAGALLLLIERVVPVTHAAFTEGLSADPAYNLESTRG